MNRFERWFARSRGKRLASSSRVRGLRSGRIGLR